MHDRFRPVFPAPTASHYAMTRALALTLLLVGAFAVASVDRPTAAAPASDRTEVVVTLASPALGLHPDGATRVAREQRAFRRALSSRVPDALIRWRYTLVANGFAVDLPGSQVSSLRRLPGVQQVYESVPYGSQLDRSPQHIGVPTLPSSNLEATGEGVKIGIIDSGVDESHSFFDPTGYAMPAGFPKGQIRYTSAKVIVARAFTPRGTPAQLPFDLSHGTHVAGIAAGNAETRSDGGRLVSGLAPRAYLGNYKVFVGSLANSPEILAAIEAAVRDGMDVINFSGGQPEIEPSRDIIALGLDAAAAAGVVSVIAAGNDYNQVGAGSVSSPGTSREAITVGAVDTEGAPAASIHADFSSVGPTAISLRLKPDIAAPGVDIRSSVPSGWTSFSGTSMAAPYVAGTAALLREAHPEWTVAQLKSALVQTATPASQADGARRAGPTFVGAGVVSLQAADRPLLFAEPTAVSWGLLHRGETVRGAVALHDAGAGAGTWHVRLQRLRAPGGTTLVIPASVEVPGSLRYEVRTTSSAAQGDLSGYVALSRGGDVRRVPVWGRVAVPTLARHRARVLTKRGVHKGTTRGQPSLVSRYRYPENPSGLGVTTVLRGPELVYRVRIRRRVANFGVAVTRQGGRASIEPRVVAGLDENRLTGYAGLPFAANPYLSTFYTEVPVAGALSPAPGAYAIVFDSPTRASAGAFTFRFWIGDVTPPRLRLRTRAVQRGAPLLVEAVDRGSGIYADSIDATVDGERVQAGFARALVRIPTASLAPGTHTLRLRVSDHQEAKNTENVARILPNTRTLTAIVTVRPRP